ncbi:hypothetical protein ACO0K9_02075 [Undibacterium sp. Ji50W]|uniref:hypothetical protein n=1 Tax=Undibacterium sp. Ji50W TaxID=3413041 RepID=UPI003BF040C8
MSAHALRRLFFRLKNLDHQVVFTELKPAVSTVSTWYPVLMELVGVATDAPSIGIPTPHGVLFLNRCDHTELHALADLIAATWISDERMTDPILKLYAVTTARQEGGFILQAGYENLCVTPQRNLYLLIGKLRMFNNPYYQDMLRHLPGLCNLNELEIPKPQVSSISS